jgi:hypothetical protein
MRSEKARVLITVWETMKGQRLNLSQISDRPDGAEQKPTQHQIAVGDVDR